jgi:ubiquinol cytochrome c reductase Fe-S subunit
MSKQADGDTTSRRDFLKLASVSAPAAVAAVALSGTEAEATETETNTSGLRDTHHTRAYYKSARF